MGSHGGCITTFLLLVFQVRDNSVPDNNISPHIHLPIITKAESRYMIMKTQTVGFKYENIILDITRVFFP